VLDIGVNRQDNLASPAAGVSAGQLCIQGIFNTFQGSVKIAHKADYLGGKGFFRIDPEWHGPRGNARQPVLFYILGIPYRFPGFRVNISFYGKFPGGIADADFNIFGAHVEERGKLTCQLSDFQVPVCPVSVPGRFDVNVIPPDLCGKYFSIPVNNCAPLVDIARTAALIRIAMPYG
jgi:hypothetical protein